MTPLSTCSGSIIASKFVVTAAHCVLMMEQHSWMGMVIVLGRGPYSGSFKDFKFVRRITVHPGYNRTSFDNDIALLETLTSIDLQIYSPVCLRKTPETFDFKMAQVIVYRDGIQKILYAHVLPQCREGTAKKSTLCAAEFTLEGREVSSNKI